LHGRSNEERLAEQRVVEGLDGVLMTEQYDQFWAEYLGVKFSDWGVPGVSVNAHVGLAGFRGVWFFMRRERLAVSAPEGWLAHINQYVTNLTSYEKTVEEAALRELFGEDFDRRIGPAFQGALTPEGFLPVRSTNVRRLADGDFQAVGAFRAECGDDDLTTSAIDKAPLYQTVIFNHGQIAAISGYRPWNDNVGDPCVLTHPKYRGCGYGAAVMSMTLDLALADGKVLLCQTLESNTPAVKLAQRLGYERYAQHVAVRLKADAPSNKTLQPPSRA
jgi:GNAT superfamily N-acetyltransferase